jgi:hypothetical protein
MIRSVVISMEGSFKKSSRSARLIFLVLKRRGRGSSSSCAQLFLPVTSSHFSPRSFLIASTFLDASSFIATKLARAAV